MDEKDILKVKGVTTVGEPRKGYTKEDGTSVDHVSSTSFLKTGIYTAASNDEKHCNAPQDTQTWSKQFRLEKVAP